MLWVLRGLIEAEGDLSLIFFIERLHKGGDFFEVLFCDMDRAEADVYFFRIVVDKLKGKSTIEFEGEF